MGRLGPAVGNVQHEGWVVPLFADGAEGVGTTGSQGVLVSTDPDEWRPDEAVVGWRPGCGCGWRGQPWTRAHSPVAAGSAAWHSPEDGAVVDKESRLIFQPGPYPSYLDDGAEQLVIEEWRQHIAPYKAAEALEEIAERYKAASRDLDDAVAAARAAGTSWADIGRAVGVTRQSAHERWGGRA